MYVPDLLFNQIDISTRFGKSLVGDLVQADKALGKVKSQNSFLKIKNPGEW